MTVDERRTRSRRSDGVQIVFTVCLAVAGIDVAHGATPLHEGTSKTRQVESRAAHPGDCPKGMKLIEHDVEAGNICEPPGTSIANRARACLTVEAGMEAVFVPDAGGVFCASMGKGVPFLERKQKEKDSRYQDSYKIDVDTACRDRLKAGADRRILDRRIVKQIVHDPQLLDRNGVRLIGGIFCDGLDLVGLDIPFSLVLDRSVFLGVVDLRNFHTTGDLALDYAVSYSKVRLTRAKVEGSIYVQDAFMLDFIAEDTDIGGSMKLNTSIMSGRLTIEKARVEGDVDVYGSFFSHFSVLRSEIKGALDLSQSQARCSYDIRKNEIGDLVATQFGFGAAASSRTERIAHIFLKITDSAAFGRPLHNELMQIAPDPYDIFADQNTATAKKIPKDAKCDIVNSINTGTFALVDNSVNSSICIRSFNWMSGHGGEQPQSNVYINEINVRKATWLDFGQAHSTTDENLSRAPPKTDHKLSLFNIQTGTLVLNFDFTAQKDVALEVNGLHFDRVYSSTAACETALALKSTRRPSQELVSFPPEFKLPIVAQVIAWVQKNKYAGTQQPFAAFVTVFERAGDEEATRNLKIQAENVTSWSPLCQQIHLLRHFPFCPLYNDGPKLGETIGSDQSILWRFVSLVWDMVTQIEQSAVVAFKLSLSLLAAHGFKPERVVWVSLLTLFAFRLAFRYMLGIVGYSVEEAPNKIKPITTVFMFDRMLPAYRIREEYYKQKQFYVLPPKNDHRARATMRLLGRERRVVEANDREASRAQRALDTLHFLGLVFAIFLVAAIGRLVR